MQIRIEEDYSDTINEDEETTSQLLEPANQYLSYIEKRIENYFSEMNEK